LNAIADYWGEEVRMRRIFAQTRKELTQILRDRRALTLALVFPLFQLMLMGSAISLSVDDLPIVVQDLDNSPASQRFVDAFRASITFHIVPWRVDRQPEEALISNTARAALIIPAHFGRSMARGADAEVQILVDSSDSNTAKLVSGYAKQITGTYNQQTAGATRPQPVQAAIRLWYNPGRSSRKFYGPGIFVLAMSLFPALLSTLAMSRETQQKTILQVYASSISAHEFLLGKIFAFMAVALAESLLLLALLFSYFGVSFIGDPTPFLVATILYTACVAAFGTLVGVAVPNPAAAMQLVALGGYLLIFLLGGLIFPIHNIPLGLRWLSNLVWGRYYVEVVRNGLLQGGGWPAAWSRVLVIGGIATAFYIIAWHKMRRMQLEA
jgi:ABC-2 type transport system permease protein